MTPAEHTAAAPADQVGVPDVAGLIERLQNLAPGMIVCDEAATALASQEGRIATLEAQLAEAIKTIADDAYAMSFQTMGQYRSALLKKVKA